MQWSLHVRDEDAARALQEYMKSRYPAHDFPITPPWVPEDEGRWMFYLPEVPEVSDLRSVAWAFYAGWLKGTGREHIG